MSLRADFMAQKRLDEEEKEIKTINQLKADNNYLNELLKQALKDYYRTLKTLAEIKEIAEHPKGCCIICDRLDKILQKINEAENDNTRNI